MTFRETSAFDNNFLDTVAQWFTARNEIFVVARYAWTAGFQEYFWFEKFVSFTGQLDLFPPQTHVIVFRDNLFPLRGIVNGDLIRQAQDLIPDHTEAMAVNALAPPDGSVVTWAWYTHVELLEILEEVVGEPASIGFYPYWHESHNEATSALIPLLDGTVKWGAY